MVAQTDPGSSPGVEQWFGFARGLPTRSARRARFGCGITVKSVQILPGEGSRAVRLRFWIRWRRTRSEKEETSRGERNEVASLGRCRKPRKLYAVAPATGRETPAGFDQTRFAPSALRFRSFSSRITARYSGGHTSTRRERSEMNELQHSDIE